MNEHIKEPLLNYTRNSNPGYAIMITGEWGIGKTHTITHLLPKEETHYVSLYGLSSETEIHSSIFDVMYPDRKKIKKILNALKGFEFNGLGLKITPSNFLLSKFLSPEEQLISKDKVLIFDDLERCNYDILKTLGVINKYVEHHGCRVIVICNDKELKTDISDIKEKIFGLTLNIHSDINTAFDAFTEKKIYSEIKERLKPLIITLFAVSQHKSLRILKHTINDCMYLYSKLEEKHKKNEEFIADLFSLFIVFSIETRAGKLHENDLKDRFKQLVNASFSDDNRGHFTIQKKDGKTQPQEPPRINTIINKYKPLSLTDDILTDDVLINTLFKGNFDKNEICASINKSKYFLQEESVQNWRIVYNFHSLADDILDRALINLENEFNERKLDITGEILHLFHLRFLLSYLGELELTYEEIEKQCKEYIDDLYHTNRLEQEVIHVHGYEVDDVYGSYDNYGYWIDDSYKEYAERVKQHLKEQRKSVLEKNLPFIQQDLLKIMQRDPREFYGLVTYNRVGPATYANIEILAGISVETFVNTWLSLPKRDWSTIASALGHRYGNKTLSKWKNEKIWLQQVIEKIDEIISQKKGIKKFQIKFLTIDQLHKVMNDLS